MSKERARRRAEREALAQAARAERARAVARRQRRRALLRRLTPDAARPAAPAASSPGAAAASGPRIAVLRWSPLAAVWLLVDSLALRLALIALLRARPAGPRRDRARPAHLSR